MAWMCRLVLACSVFLSAHTLPSPEAAQPATDTGNGSGVEEVFQNVSGTGGQHLEQPKEEKAHEASQTSAKQPSSLSAAHAPKEHALLCPHGFCKQPKPMPAGWIAEEVLDHPETYGPASLFRECAQKTNSSMIVPVTAWNRSQGLDLKRELEQDGFHMEWCPLELAGAMWFESISVYTEEQQARLGVDQFGNWYHPEL